jgi:hypothetical protein
MLYSGCAWRHCRDGSRIVSNVLLQICATPAFAPIGFEPEELPVESSHHSMSGTSPISPHSTTRLLRPLTGPRNTRPDLSFGLE